jgi:hypothetical protein
MKLAVLASLIASAAAFAPAQPSAKAASSSALSMAFENELGAQPPLGFFDPLGIVADGDQLKFDRLRFVELKHGRICMLGVVGYLVTAAGIRLPGLISLDGTKFSDIPSGWAGSEAVPAAGALQVRVRARKDPGLPPFVPCVLPAHTENLKTRPFSLRSSPSLASSSW